MSEGRAEGEMSLEDIDRAPRLRDTRTADQLATEACVHLAATVLEEAAQDYVLARRDLMRHPHDRIAQEHVKTLQRFYRSILFRALSAGMVDGETVMKELDRQVRRERDRDKPGEAVD